MSLFFERVRRWYDASLSKLQRRSWKAWAIVVGVVFILAEAARSVMSDASTLLVVWLYRGALWLALQPMGVGGLAVVTFLLVLTGVAWWESRPEKLPPPAEPAPLSEGQRRLVQDLRTVWGRHGALAIGQLHGIIRDLVFGLENRVYWSPLLRPVVDTLESKRQEFEGVIEPAAKSDIETVRKHFNAMYGAYFQAMKWVAILESREPGTIRRSDDRLTIWRQNHRDMINRLHDLEEDPEHKGTLAIHSQWIDEPEFRAFLTEAQYSEDWLKIMRVPASEATMPESASASEATLPTQHDDEAFDPEASAS